jgi:hypothetical protein
MVQVSSHSKTACDLPGFPTPPEKDEPQLLGAPRRRTSRTDLMRLRGDRPAAFNGAIGGVQ